MVRYEAKKHLVEYFKKNMSKGYPTDALKWALIKQGYMKLEVTNALEQANEELAEKAPVLKEKPKIKYQIIDEHDRPIDIKFSFWRRLRALFR